MIVSNVHFKTRLADWAEAVLAGGELEQMVVDWSPVNTSTIEMQKFKAGFLLKEILGHSTAKLESTLSPNRSLWMYSVHDLSIINILNSLGLFEVSLNRIDLYVDS